MAELLKPNLCVIGAGPGGLDVAMGAAAFGTSVVLVERAAMGGRWLNGGALAMAALLAAARQARNLAEAGAFGITTSDRAVDFAKLRAHVAGVVATSVPNATKVRLTALGIRVVEGAARFTDKRTVAVGDEAVIKARRVVIATGSSAVAPAIAGLDGVPFLTEDTILDLLGLPAHLVVIGARPIGLALAQALRWLGSAVTVLDPQAPLAGEDPECAAVVLDQLVRDGITLRTGVTVARVEPAGLTIKVVLAGAGGEETIEASHLMVAGARKPNVEGLRLDDARITHTADGIVVDNALRTSNKRVYAIGDVIGARSLAAARHHAGLVVRSLLFRQTVRLDREPVARVIFTEPALARVGLGEVAARRRGAIRVLRWPYRENDRAQALHAVRGHIKVVTDRKGTVLGATIVGPEAVELLAPWSLAVGQGLNIRALAGMTVPYPTLGEAGKRAATTYFMLGLTSSWVRRIMAWLRRLG
jgi:pyruvate/2-oxoglutarate dehydrogenase complex dihydrolipoamide dehydrogenase (E3) component